MARDQVSRSLAIAAKGAITRHRVWCWDDAWKAMALAHAEPPARLSDAGLRAVLAEAIERCRADGGLAAIGRSLSFAGYRRQLLDRFAGWGRLERSPAAPPVEDSATGRDEWHLYGHYRGVLADLEAVDRAGWAAWASREIARSAPPGLRKPGMVVVLDPVDPGRAGWRVLDHCQKVAKGMLVLLPYSDEPTMVEPYAGPASSRQRFLDWGFQEATAHQDWFRPAGLKTIELEVFRPDAHARPKVRLGPDSGLRILGGPRGEGLALLVARQVRAELERGVEPDQILILVPRPDSDAELIRSTLRSWGLPAADPPVARLAAVPALAALRRAMRLPVEGWDMASLSRLLRNGRIDWGDAEASAFARFEAASAIRATRVFRDRAMLLRALERPSPGAAERPGAKEARALVERLSTLIDPLARTGPWRVQDGRLRRLAGGLGLLGPDLDPLWDALDDARWVREGLGPSVADQPWSWAEFADEVDAIVTEQVIDAAPPAPGTIRIEPVGSADGARVRVVILANLAERTFPSADAIDLGPATPDAPAGAGEPDPVEEFFEDETPPEATAYGREMLRFLRVAGMADERLILAYPTTDLNGERLLPAGFLDDVVRRLDGGYAAPVVEIHQRFDPVLLGHDDLAVAPTDARVLAVARAFRDDDFDAVRRVARVPGHGRALEGTASALEVAQERHHDRAFSSFDGLLANPAAIAKIREKFGPSHPFSASQLETFALCPFQFFLRYVLGLKPVDERRELDEDYAGRGSDVHRILETIHLLMASESDVNLVDRLDELIRSEMQVELDQFDGAAGDVSLVLREIGSLRTRKILGRYHAQFRTYVERGGTPSPHKFEVRFGQPDKPDSLDHLTIGEGDSAVRFQGVIDRIDLVQSDGRTGFRVIDYKTGSNPSKADVLSGQASQLPLYALAVEQLILPGGDHPLLDVGYWSLHKEGFSRVKLDDWDGYRSDLIAFVQEIVAKLRGGRFPIDSRKKDCNKYCDFQAMCRVSQVRRAGKIWTEMPLLGGRVG
ncbi:PD-(D/E)XK nuclease family protein [Tundrisphaera sp. TA3]|uniref:PD-(D/E)XK nuclease family protein n=1 Tax=Tundrisphaera sp. TA3 TaxID=3435775 RepID=UPI003EBC39D9